MSDLGTVRERATRGCSVAVVGAGVFGCSAALELSRQGHAVTLFESRDEIFQAASFANQYRFHAGYHYPRSAETIRQCRESQRSFSDRFPDAIDRSAPHYYAVAKEGSKCSAEEIRSIWQQEQLPFREARLDVVDERNLAWIAVVPEASIDMRRVALQLRAELDQSNVQLLLGTEFHAPLRSEFDMVVLATYRSNSRLQDELGIEPDVMQFELCEKPVVRPPRVLEGLSLVVLDGPFGCIDPIPGSDCSVLGHVVHAIHVAEVGVDPVAPTTLDPFVDTGVVDLGSQSRAQRMIDGITRFLPALGDCEVLGSMLTWRTVLAHRDFDDARPTLVDETAPGVFRVHSGKICTAQIAAEHLAQMVGARTA